MRKCLDGFHLHLRMPHHTLTLFLRRVGRGSNRVTILGSRSGTSAASQLVPRHARTCSQTAPRMLALVHLHACEGDVRAAKRALVRLCSIMACCGVVVLRGGSRCNVGG